MSDIISLYTPYCLQNVNVAAGNFVYIARSDLVPELLDQKDLGKGLFQFGLMALGVLLMYLVKLL